MYIHKRLVAVRRSYEFEIGYVRGAQRGGIDGAKTNREGVFTTTQCFYCDHTELA
jgi:hypothetical protein